MNKVGGFLQRIDYARKYAFGAMCILKDDKGQFPIRGAWIFRGQAILPMMVEVRSWSWCFAFACPRAPHISYNLNHIRIEKRGGRDDENGTKTGRNGAAEPPSTTTEREAHEKN